MSALLLLVLTAAPDGGVVDGGVPAPGEYWVLRLGQRLGTGSSGWPGPDGGAPETRFEWSTRCDRARLDGKSLELEGGEVSFTVSRGLILQPTVKSRYRASARATGTCRAAWPRAPTFDSYEACSLASPPRVAKRCVRDACEWEPRAPWLLDDCEDEVLRLRLMVGFALEPTHGEAMRTLTRFEQVLARGGVMFVSPGCEPVKITARDAEGFNELDTTNLAQSWHARTQVLPLFGESRNTFESGTTDGGGSWGSSTTVDSVLLGKDQVFLGSRLLSFDRQRCRAP